MNDILVISKNANYNSFLRNFLAKVDNFDIVNPTDLAQAKKLMRKNSIILLDPSLMDERLFELLNSITSTNEKATIYDDKRRGDFKISPSKYENNADIKTINLVDEHDTLSAMKTKQPQPGKDSFFIKNGKKREIIPFDTIISLEAEGNYTYIHTTATKYVLKKPLRRILENLDDRFQQCHKKYCININHIRSLKQNSVILTNGVEIPITYFYKKDFIQKVYAVYPRID